MANLTRSFRDTVVARARHDSAFRAALIEEAQEAIRDGKLEEARVLLRDAYDREPPEDLAGFAREMAAIETIMRRNAGILRALADK